MSGHTPGPWRVAAIYDDLVVDSNGNKVAVVDGDGTTGDEDARRARLIAAAPEMLEALREAEKTIRRLAACGSLDPRFVAIESQVGIGLIHAAIAKAAGEGR